jgi:multidrug efflux pump subunit AcrB
MAARDKQTKDKFLQRLALFFFNRPRQTALLALTLAFFGVLSYTTLLKREGFPPINIPYAIGQATYLVNDPARVDTEVAKPLSEFILKQPDVKTVQTTSLGNFVSFYVQFTEEADAVAQSKALQKQLTEKRILPGSAQGRLVSVSLRGVMMRLFLSLTLDVRVPMKPIW